MSPDQLSATAGESLLYCAEDASSFDEDDEYVPIDDEFYGEFCNVSPENVEELVAVEADYFPGDDYLSRYLSRELDATARHDAVTWILKVNEFYRFSPVTAYLAVSYLDRFLAANTLPPPTNGGRRCCGRWPMQLLSVACVAVAAKMDEMHVPLLLDLQILDPGFIFEPKTVQRMELLLMSSLGWRLRSVTPFAFLHHFSVSVAADRRRSLLSRAADLVVRSHRVVDFLRFMPSELAAAAAMCAATEGGDLSSTWLVNKEKVTRCRQLMEEYLIDTCPSANQFKLTRVPPPLSPVGVLDAADCGSCVTQKSSATELDQPATKRRRLFCTDSTSIVTRSNQR